MKRIRILVLLLALLALAAWRENMSLTDLRVGDFTIEINALATTVISVLLIVMVAFAIERFIRPRLLRSIVSQVREGADDEVSVRFQTVANAVARVASWAIFALAMKRRPILLLAPICCRHPMPSESTILQSLESKSRYWRRRNLSTNGD